MSTKKTSAQTDEELDAVAKAGGFHLEKSTIGAPFLAFLREYGVEDVCIAKDVPGGMVTLYAIIKLTKRKLGGKEMQAELRPFLSKYGVVNNCPCTLLSNDVMSITADVRTAERASERLPIVRSRRSPKQA